MTLRISISSCAFWKRLSPPYAGTLSCFVLCTRRARLKASDLLLTKAHTGSSINKFIMILRPISLLLLSSWRGLGRSIGSRDWLPSWGAGPLPQQRDPLRWGHDPLPGTDVVAPTLFSPGIQSRHHDHEIHTTYVNLQKETWGFESITNKSTPCK